MIKYILILLFCSLGYGQVIVNNPYVTFPESPFDLTSAIAGYSFEDNANDIINSYNGTVTNATYVAGGVIGKALSMDGVGDYMSVPDNNIWSHGNGTTDTPFSFVMSVKFDDTGDSFLACKRGLAGAAYHEWQFIKYNGKLTLAQFSQNQSTVYISEDYTWTPTTGVWYRLGFSSDGSGNIKLYIDGSSVTTTPNNAGTYVAMSNTDTPMYFGVYGPAPTHATLGLAGDMDVVYAFSRQLSDAEFLDDYNRTLAGKLITE